MVSVDLSSYTISGAVQIRFVVDEGDSNGYYDDVAIDDVKFDELDYCFPALNLTANYVAPTQVELSWDDLVTSTNWNIQYGASNFGLGTGTTVSADANPYTVTGLTSNTTYDFYIQNDCADSNSSWQGPITVTTPCEVTAPYTEEFSYNTPSCWNNNDNTYPYWYFSTYNYYSGDNGDMGGSTISDSYFAYVDGSYLTYYDDGTTLTSPFVDVSDLESPAIHFFLNSNNQGYGNIDFSVDIFDGSTWNNDAFTSNENTDGWEFVSIDLSDYTITGSVAARFHASYPTSSYAYYDDLAIDDVMFDELDVCLPPVDIALENITATSAEVVWTDLSDSATAWNVEYGTSGFTQGSGTTIDVSANPYTLSELLSNTSYDVYIQTECTSNSTWQGPYTFTTLCEETAPYWEDFESYNTPDCWTNDPDGYPQWYFSNYASHAGYYSDMGTATTISQNYFAYVDDSNTHSNGTILSTPAVDVSNLTTPAIHFFLNSNNEGDPNLDFSVDIFDGSQWNNDAYTSDNNTDGWEFISIDLSDYTITGNVVARFKVSEASSSYGNQDDVAIDDVMFDELDICLPPTDVTLNNITATSLDISWSDLDDTYTSWNIEYGASGFTQGSGTTLDIENNPYNLTGLSPNTTYDIYIQTECTTNSIWQGPFTVTTLCQETAPYWESFTSYNTPDCWENDPDGYPQWYFSTYVSHAGYYGDMGTEETLSGSYFAYVDDSNSHYNGTTLSTPSVDVSSLTTPALHFYLNSNNEGDPNLDFSVDFFDGSSWNTDIYTSNTNTDGWEFVSIDLSSYNITGPVQARFITTESSYGNQDDVALDDIMFDEFDICLPITTASVSNIANDNVDVTWTNNNEGTSWNIQYGETDFTIGTGTTVSASSTTYNLSDLNGSTTYDVYIQNICDTETVSAWYGPITFTTLNDPPSPPEGVTCSTEEANYVFTEEFDTLGDWTGDVTSGNSYSTWEIPGTSENYYTGPNTAYSGSNYMLFESSSSYYSTKSAISPAIDLSEASEEVELSFYYFAYGYNIGTFDVGIATSSTGPFTNLFTYTGQYQTTSVDSWIPIGLDISEYAGETVYIQFKQTHTSGSSGDVAVDFLRVQTCMDICNSPENIVASNITSSSANINWDDTNVNTEDTWEYIIQESGTEIPDETDTGIAVSTLPISLEGLQANTTYEVFVRSNCDVDFNSDWSDAYTFTTLIQTEYTIFCSAGPTSVNYCYENDDNTMYHFTSSDGATQLNILFNQGSLADENDQITVYDSDESTILYQGTGADGDLSGTNFISTGSELFVSVTSDSTNSCSDGANVTPINFTVNCYTCVSPTVAYSVISDCAEAPQFVINVDITDFGSASSLLINDNQGTDELTITTPDVYIFGPYDNGTNVNITVANADDQNCSVYSGSMTQEECPPIYDVACNTIEAGDDQTVDCGTSEVELEANFTFSGTDTSTYQLSSIACNPEIEEGTSSQVTVDDQYSGIIDIGFDFCFFGETYNQLVIGANGVISFNTSLANTFCPWSFSDQLPSPSLPTNAIFGVFQDINPAYCGDIEYLVSGESPNRSFVINYNDVCLFSCSTETTTSQIILHEATNAIEINIIDKPVCTSWNNGYALAGLQNADGTIGYAPPGRNTEVWTAENEYWRYVPAGPANYSFEWLDGSTSLGSDASITVSPLETTTYTAQISYNKCDGSLATLTDDVTVTVNTPVAENEFTIENAINLIPITSADEGTIGNDAYNFSAYVEEPLEPIPSCFAGSIDESSWFSFTAPYSGEVEINTYIPDGASSVEIAVYSGGTTSCTQLITTGEEIACATNSDIVSLELTDENALTPGEIYYVQVNNVADATETFGIEVVQVGCIPPSYETPIIVNDCDNDQYYVSLNITDLGNGTPLISDGSNTWNISATGTIQAGPFDIAETSTLTLQHGIDGLCDIDLGEFSSICAPDCVSNVIITLNETCGNYETSISWDSISNASGYNLIVGTSTGSSDILELDLGNITEYSVTGTVNTTYYVTITPYNDAGTATGCDEHSFTTIADQCYCEAIPEALEGNGITSVTINSTEFTPETYETYTDFTDSAVNVQQDINTTVDITFEIGYPYDYAIWVDFNNDYTLDTTELLYSGTSGYDNPDEQQASFVIPSTVSTGNHLMRIVSASTGTQLSPCYNGNWGVVQDFMLNVNPTACSPATYDTPIVDADCDNDQFYIDINITDLGNGSPSITDGTDTWNITATGAMQIGPFEDSASVDLMLNHGTDTDCDVDLGSFTYTCPVPCYAASYSEATINEDCDNDQFYVTLEVTDIGDGTSTVTDGVDSWNVTTTGTMQVGPFENGASVELTLTGSDTSCDTDLGSFTYTCPVPCVPVTYSTVDGATDCDNDQYYVIITVTSFGDGSSYFTDGTNMWNIVYNGQNYIGPFASGSTVDISITHETDTVCDSFVGTYTYTCPVPCEAATYDTLVVNGDCDNDQFYVDINITDLGNGSPFITDGTDTWNITSTGNTQIGPFEDGANVSLTLNHGSDDSCDIDLGSFTYTCPTPCEAVIYDTPTIAEDCDNEQFYVEVDITDLGNGTSSITDGFNTWNITETGVLQVGPFDSGSSAELLLLHGTDGSCDIDLGSFTYTCPFICESPTYGFSNINEDCENEQFYVNVDITSLGNGSPGITDGTTTWDVTAIGAIQVGPFENESTVTLTLNHGIDSDCNVDLGSFTYACATPPANDDLCNAINLDVLDSSQIGSTDGDAYTTVDATLETNEPVPSCFNTSNGSVWFSFIAPEGGEVQITTDIPGGTLTDTQIAIYSASSVSCSDMTSLATSIDCDQDNGVTIPNNSDIQLTDVNALVEGEMYYIQVDYTGEAGTFGIEVIDLATNAIKGAEHVEFSYYPNPVKYHKLNLQANMPINSIEVYNMLGQNVLYLTPESTTYTIDMKQLASGNYIIKVMVGEYMKTIKISKE
ncbi:fibronectin type III domain-containing protein [Pustulibacterium marinum]|uniref:fibronectin type III domain-containing protein n=1 Tax=Pustulibacterium marinum TaxID=1224947 RepID=UPI001C432080|nr:fibronectin type III domain-containing protein [Pustulibacterium marinum]